MTVAVGETSLSRSRHGLVTGAVYFVLDGYAFPERDWSDFPVVVLSWWLEKAAAMLEGRSQSVDFQFMDGPYMVVATCEADRSLRLDGVRNASKRQIIASGGTSLQALCSDLTRAAGRIERACLERGWDSEDAQRLSQNVRSLERLLAEKREGR